MTATEAEPVSAGLRVDVDTMRGTARGVPKLLAILQRRNIKASFFFSVGPDNMGRHLWRMLRPSFAVKMLRTGAPGLYGWDILLRGTAWPGQRIGARHGQIIRDTARAGHEVGLHAWDHHRWQARADSMSDGQLRRELGAGIDALHAAGIDEVACSAAPGWQCTESVLREKERLAMRYHSDCRGVSIFRPRAGGAAGTPQIPVTLPTYDELVGRNGVSDENYNETLLRRFRPDGLNVLTVHAEVEGISRAALFEDFLAMAADRNIRFVPLGDLLPPPDTFAPGTIAQGEVAGRAGRLCVQSSRP